MSAFILSHIKENSYPDLASQAGYGGDLNFPLLEGFRREASIAIELILKAILCLRTKSAPPSTHDVYELWPQAGLPKLSDDDSYRLADMTQILYWSGRYAAPRLDRDLNRSYERFEKHEKTEHFGKLKVSKNTQFGWTEFDAIYQTANRHFWELDPNDPKNFVA